jgi:hypothetical protein
MLPVGRVVEPQRFLTVSPIRACYLTPLSAAHCWCLLLFAAGSMGVVMTWKSSKQSSSQSQRTQLLQRPSGRTPGTSETRMLLSPKHVYVVMKPDSAAESLVQVRDQNAAEIKLVTRGKLHTCMCCSEVALFYGHSAICQPHTRHAAAFDLATLLPCCCCCRSVPCCQ